MNKVKKFEDLEIWQKVIEVAVQIFKITDHENFKYKFALKDQIQRSAISISSNIAEGFECGNNGNFIRFLNYAKGSCGELRSQLHVAFKLDLVNEKLFVELNEVLIILSRKIAAFVNYLKKFEAEKIKSNKPATFNL